VYDAAAGSINGSGWIPAGAGAKTSFDVDVRYAGSSVPVGTAGIVAQGGALTVRATRFDWLVVQGAVATVRGAGTLADGTAVGFQLAGKDGKSAADRADRMRVRVWNLATGAVLYDSEPSAPDLAAPTTALGGGNVTVHR